MKFAVLANDNDFNLLSELTDNAEWVKTTSIAELLSVKDVTAIFNMNEDSCLEDYTSTTVPVFINSVCYTLKERNHSSNVVRINGWTGFLNRPIWEIAGPINNNHISIIEQLKKKYTLLADEPGFISARIIAMIINEGFFAKGEKVSTEDEIDIAMKLGTNYPKGPFEWMREIGLKNVYNLLCILSKSDKRYTPAPLLQTEANPS